jgi:hypothetical protein
MINLKGVCTGNLNLSLDYMVNKFGTIGIHANFGDMLNTVNTKAGGW